MLRSRSLALAALAVVANLFGAACDEDEACGECGDDQVCNSMVKSSIAATGDIEVVDAAGERIAFLMGPSPGVGVVDTLEIDLGDAEIALPAPSEAGTSSVEGRVCDVRGVGAPRCATFRGTIDVRELVPGCGSGGCGRLDLTLRIDDDDDDAAVRIRGSIQVERRERVDHRCVPDPEVSCTRGCSSCAQGFAGPPR